MAPYHLRLHHRLPLLLLLGTILLTGCSLRPVDHTGPRAPQGKLITAEEIQRSGAADAWEVLQRRGTHLILRETRTGEPGRIWRRGQTTIILRDDPLIVVDGTRLFDVRVLRQVKAHAIYSIRILDGIHGAAEYGSNAANGAIVVTTRTH